MRSKKKNFTITSYVKKGSVAYFAVESRFNTIKKTTTTRFRNVVAFIRRKPLTSFFGALLLLLGVIIINSIISSPKKEQATVASAQKVKVYAVGSAPRMQLQGKVEKDGVVKIVAQMSGIVQSINVAEGSDITKGANIIQLASNYQGGNAPALQTQLAEKQKSLVEASYQPQKDIIAKQKEIAEKTSTNTEELRKISEKTLSDTRSLLDLNNEIVSSLNDSIETLSSAGSSSAVLQIKQLKSQYQAAINGLQAQQRSLEYQTNTDNPPTQLANLQKDITIKQLEIQEKSLDINREISTIQLNLAYITSSLMHPTSPFAGRVERILVQEGESVTPGTVLAIVSSNTISAHVVVPVSRQLAENISTLEDSHIYINGTTIDTHPTSITTQATDGQLYGILYTIPDSYQAKLTDGSYVVVDVPIGIANTSKVIPFVPLDAIFQTQDSSFLYIVKNNKAKSQKVTLGNVYGSFVEVVDGLSDGDQIILDRTVIENDPVIPVY